MTPYDVDTTRFVLAVALAFIIATGLVYRFFRWIRRRRAERHFDQFAASQTAQARTTAKPPGRATQPPPSTAEANTGAAAAANSDAVLALINGSQPTASSSPAPQTRAPAYQAPEPVAVKTPAPAPVTAPVTLAVTSHSEPAHSEPAHSEQATSAVPASDAILALINGAQPAPTETAAAPPASTLPDVAAISAAIAAGREAARRANAAAVVEPPDVPDPPARETATPAPAPASAATPAGNTPAENTLASASIKPDVSATIDQIGQRHTSAPAHTAAPDAAPAAETHVKPDMLFTLAPGACKKTAAAAALLPPEPAPDFTIREVRTVMPDVRATLSPHAGASAPAVPPPAAGATPAASSNTSTETVEAKPETPRAHTATRRIGKAAGSAGLISTAPLSRKVLLGKVIAADKIQQAAFRPLKKRAAPYISSLSPEKVGFDPASLRQRLFGGDPPPHTPQR